MSSKARSTVLFPEPESPVRITSWRASRLSTCFTGRSRSVFNPALVGAGDAHIFAVFCDGTAGKGEVTVAARFCDLFARGRFGGGFFPPAAIHYLPDLQQPRTASLCRGDQPAAHRRAIICV